MRSPPKQHLSFFLRARQVTCAVFRHKAQKSKATKQCPSGCDLRLEDPSRLSSGHQAASLLSSEPKPDRKTAGSQRKRRTVRRSSPEQIHVATELWPPEPDGIGRRSPPLVPPQGAAVSVRASPSPHSNLTSLWPSMTHPVSSGQRPCLNMAQTVTSHTVC